ncbi:MAG: LytR C-terminal domain-containing protein [Endomicrobium sp.]|nr:LytR C-terminal domain-containing protein [Endomicrobium sp.]
MFQTLRKIAKRIGIITFLLLIVFIAAYVYIYKNDKVYSTSKDKKSVSFSVLLYDIESVFGDRLDSYQIVYDYKDNLLKVLCVNTDTIVFKKRERAKSLKTLFYENRKKDLGTAIDKFYSDLDEVIGNASVSDFYINTSFKTFNDLFGSDKNIRALLSANEFISKDLELLNCLEIIERILYLAPYKFLEILKNYEYLNTDIPKTSLATLMFKVKKQAPEIMFCEMPVKYRRTRIEPNKQDIESFLDKIYYRSTYINEKSIIIDVKNASRQSRMGQKVAWLLRDNKFDVLDWSSFPIVYDKTLIKDYKGNFTQSLKISKILGTGKVIVSYNSSVYTDINVFIGKDCKIYDSLDKKGDTNGKH